MNATALANRPLNVQRKYTAADIIWDPEGYAKYGRWRWTIIVKRGKPTGICTTRDNQTLYLNRLLNNTPIGVECDHKNGDVMDMRKQNLRNATRSQNVSNVTLKSNNTSGFVGVGFHKHMNKWTAYAAQDGKQRHLGYYATPEEAARIRDEFVRENLDKEYQVYNFPKNGERSV